MIRPRVSIRSLLFFLAVVALGLCGLVYPDWTITSLLHLALFVVLATAWVCVLLNFQRPRYVGILVFGTSLYLWYELFFRAPHFPLMFDTVVKWTLVRIHPAAAVLTGIERENIERPFTLNFELLFILVMSGIGGVIGDTIGHAQASPARRGQEGRGAESQQVPRET